MVNKSDKGKKRPDFKKGEKLKRRNFYCSDSDYIFLIKLSSQNNKGISTNIRIGINLLKEQHKDLIINQKTI